MRNIRKSHVNKMLRFKSKTVEKQRRKAIGPYRSKAYGSQLQSYDLRCSFFVLLSRQAGKCESKWKRKDMRNGQVLRQGRPVCTDISTFYEGKQVN